MASHTLRNGNQTIIFTTNDNGTVTVDEGDYMPYTMTTDEGRIEWRRLQSQGFRVVTDQPAATAPVAKAPSVAASTSGRSRPASQTERTVNKTMESRRIAGAGPGSHHDSGSRVEDMSRVLTKLQSEGGLVIVNYYIPVELSTSRGTRGQAGYQPIRIQNPAADFRAFAVHLDGSNWLMTATDRDNATVSEFFATMDEYKDFVGGEGEPPAYWDTQLRDEEYSKFLAIAQRKLDRHIRALHASLIECIGNADTALQDAMQSEEWQSMTQKQREAAESYRDNRVRSRIKKADEELNAAIACAETFDMTENLSDLIAALRAAIRSQRESFNVIARRKRIKAA